MIRLTDRPGTDDAPGRDGRTGGRNVRVRVLGRHAPGSPLGHDWLDCEITVTADSVRGQFVTLVTDRQLRQWDAALDRLGQGCAVRWLDEEHGPELRIEPGRPGGLWVTVSDAEDSGVTLRVVLSPAPGWLDEQRALLKLVRDAYPPGTLAVEPGAHDWPGTTTEEH
ncbi:DUF5959 family protein [Kitasatospora sp. NPDC093550]|uniref:DUF5959 family protein n=1 Tax=Kitasatospora sp. NPDC093550 TaxID=3364089 RepID=UPI003808CAE5